MLEIIKHRERRTGVSYSWVFDWEGKRNWGFSFPCTENGELIEPAPAAQANFAACKTGKVDGRAVVDRGIERREWSYSEPAVGRCACGREVCLAGFTNTCECGRDYNMSGQELAPRECWGEETGENWSDCY